MSKNTFMDYSAAKDWILAEKDFSTELLGKCEAVMCQGNGYMGLRCATEEQYLGEQRNLFVAGTFNKFDENEVTELPNAADVLNLTLRINGQRFDLTQGKILTYHRQLNLRTGEMVRSVRWQAPAGEVLDLEFKRIVSFARLHVITQSVTIRADRDVKLVVESGINGQMTNTGSQHFSEGEKRLYDGAVMQYTQTTIQSKIDFFFNTRLRFFKNGTEQQEKGFITMDRRRIDMRYTLELAAGEALTIEKISTVHTSRDKDAEGVDFKEMQTRTLAQAEEAQAMGYQALADESAAAWNERVWDRVAVTVESEDEFDALALHFAQYHLFSDGMARTALKNTLSFAVVVVPIQTILSLIIAAVLDSNIKGRYTFRTIYFLPTLTSSSALTIIFMFMFSVTGPVNNLLIKMGFLETGINFLNDPSFALKVIMVMNIWSTIPQYTTMYLASLQDLPGGMYEAAAIDGAGPVRRFWAITVPYLKPITTYVLLTSIIGTLQMFDQAYIFSNGSGGPANSTLTVSLLVYRYAFGTQNAMGYAATMAIVLAVIIMIVSFTSEKLNASDSDY